MSASREPRNTFERVLARRTEAMAEGQAQRVTELMQQGRSRGDTLRSRRALFGAVSVVLTLMLGRLVYCGGGAARRGNEPIGAAAVATADGAGVGSSASGFLPQSQTHSPTPAPSAEPPAPQKPADAARPATAARPSAPPRVKRQASEADPSTAPLLLGGRSETYAARLEAPVAPSPEPSPRSVLNVGTRLPVRLDAPLRTGAALVPVTATLVSDVVVAGRVRLPAGTLLVGSAFATPHDDRVQILWRAVVHDGRTLAFEGETLGADGAPGLTGKVIARRRKGVLRRVGSAMASTAGEVAGVAVPLGDGLFERAGSALAGHTGQELSQWGSAREWLQADTVVELKAGSTCLVFVSADLVLPDPAPTPAPPGTQP